MFESFASCFVVQSTYFKQASLTSQNTSCKTGLVYKCIIVLVCNEIYVNCKDFNVDLEVCIVVHVVCVECIQYYVLRLPFNASYINIQACSVCSFAYLHFFLGRMKVIWSLRVGISCWMMEDQY